MSQFRNVHEAITGSIKAPHWLQPNACLAECKIIYNGLRQANPNVHKAYSQYRLWALVYWQPVYIAISAVHLNHGVVDLCRLRQIRHQYSISGYVEGSLAFKPSRRDLNHLIIEQSHSLKKCLSGYLHELESLAHYKAKQAWGLIADCIALALMKLRQYKDLSPEHLNHVLQQWLLNMGLQDISRKPVQPLIASSDSNIELKRSHCCFHYLLDPNDICSGCPKYKNEKRKITIS